MHPTSHRILACAALGLAWAGIAGAGDALAECRDIREDTARLACYDALADRNVAGTALPVAASAAPAAAAQPPPSPEELFGQRGADVVQRTTGTEQLEELTANVTEVQASPSGKVTLALDNGQVWSQVDTTSARIKTGDEVRIRRGMLGSYLLTRSNGGPAIRVHRTR